MRTLLSILATLVLLYCLMFHNLGTRELWSSHEARAAQDAQSILDGGDWRLPRLFDGRPELQKPPLYYWITALFGWYRGAVDETTVRLPAVLGSILTGLALFLFLRQSGHPCAAWLCPILLWTMIHFTWMSRVGRIDMPLTAATTWSIVSFFLALKSTAWRRHAWFLLAYLALAAGIMLKGPIAAVLVAIVLVPWLLINLLRNDPMHWQGRAVLSSTQQNYEHVEQSKGASGILEIADWKALLLSTTYGIPLLIALILPWCWWVNETTGGQFLNVFVIKHNLQRGFGGDEQLDGHLHPAWFYFVRFWADTAPWGWLLPLVIIALIRKRLDAPLVSLGITWFASIFILLSCMQYKRADYLLPAYPGLALALSLALDAWLKQAPSVLQLRVQRYGLGLVTALALGWFAYAQWILPRLEPSRALGPFAHKVREYLPSPGQVILFRIDSHHLTWELGKKTERIWEWENLSWWATRPAPIFVIMPQHYAKECKDQLLSGELIPITSTNDYTQGNHDVPLVLLVNGYGKVLAQRE